MSIQEGGEAQKINLLELTDHERAKVLKKAKVYLQQQVAESKSC
jgi:hypothetical protein